MELRKSHNEKADAFPLAEGNTDTPVNLDEGRSASPESKSSARAHKPSAREPGDLERASSPMVGDRQPRKGKRRNPRSKALEESDAVVVPEKSPNAQVTLAEVMEGRTAAKGKLASRNASRTQGRQARRAHGNGASRTASEVERERGVEQSSLPREGAAFEARVRSASKRCGDGCRWDDVARVRRWARSATRRPAGPDSPRRISDANSMRAALRKRLRAFGLELHAEKTRVLRFGRYARERCEALGKPPESFDFLGFTHINGSDRRGWFQLVRHTKRSRRVAKLAELRLELRRRRHEAVIETHAWLTQVLRGHYAYFGVPTNERALTRFRHHLQRAWYAQLERRSQRARRSVTEIKRFERRFPLLRPQIHHPWPEQRFADP
jgi:hypothetical protein